MPSSNPSASGSPSVTWAIIVSFTIFFFYLLPSFIHCIILNIEILDAWGNKQADMRKKKLELQEMDPVQEKP